MDGGSEGAKDWVHISVSAHFRKLSTAASNYGWTRVVELTLVPRGRRNRNSQSCFQSLSQIILIS
jgi:hypothetical protein